MDSTTVAPVSHNVRLVEKATFWDLELDEAPEWRRHCSDSVVTYESRPAPVLELSKLGADSDAETCETWSPRSSCDGSPPSWSEMSDSPDVPNGPPGSWGQGPPQVYGTVSAHVPVAMVRSVQPGLPMHVSAALEARKAAMACTISGLAAASMRAMKKSANNERRKATLSQRTAAASNVDW